MTVSCLPDHSAYTAEGRRLPGVTNVLGQFVSPELAEWFKRKDPREIQRIRTEAAEFGTSVHAALAVALRGGRLLALGLSERWQAVVDAGRAWIDDNVAEIVAVEEPVASLKYGYAGTPDAVVRLTKSADVCTVLDWKNTGALYWDVLFQTAAYRQALVESGLKSSLGRLVVRFDRDEPGRIHLHHLNNHERDFAGFSYLLATTRIMEGAM